jgi:hypothetical protein
MGVLFVLRLFSVRLRRIREGVEHSFICGSGVLREQSCRGCRLVWSRLGDKFPSPVGLS